MFIQIYDVETGNITDAHHTSFSFPELEGVKLDPNEIKKPDSEVIAEAIKKTIIKLRTNPQKKIRNENIEESLVNQPIYEKDKFQIAKSDAKASEDVFKLLQENEVITASRTKESLMDVPASIMVITEQDFKNRGYMNLEDVFRDVPGFDFIGLGGADPVNLYQRGYRTPYTSRTLLMIDGILQNDLWAQVATIDKTYPISNIKRIEIIYGPASAVYGPNAFQGIINIITKTSQDNGARTFGGKTSFMYGTGPLWTTDGTVHSQIGDLGVVISARTSQGLDANENVKGKGFHSPFYIRNPQFWGPVLYYGDKGKPMAHFKTQYMTGEQS